MLRVRRGVGAPVNYTHLCRPYIRCPRQCTISRSFATETNPDETSKTSAESKHNIENVRKRLRASSAKLQSSIKRIEKQAKEAKIPDEVKDQKDAKAKVKGSRKATSKPKSDDPNFNETLDVVRRVYGVEDAKGKKKKKGSKPNNTKANSKANSKAKDSKAQNPGVAQEMIKENNSGEETSQAVGQQASVWTSLREKLQQAVATEPSNTLDASQEDPTAPSLHDGQHVIGIGETGKAGQSLGAEPSSEEVDPKAKPTPQVHTITPRDLKMKPVEKLAHKVPHLAYNLDKVLFNHGPYQLQDQRTRTYNFDPYLGSIMPVKEFDFDALKEYVTSSKDTRLTDLAAKYHMKYCGSTSSMTAMLAHFHFLLSNWRPPNFEHLSRSFKVEWETYTLLTRGPAAAFARYKDGVYAIDADKEFDTASVLSMLGKSMEKLLTLPKPHFEKYRKSRSHELSDEEKNADEAFHYTTMGDFMMRSQLDAHDPRLPGTGMFDLKTRAVVSIRMDVGDYEKGVGYEIRNRYGTWESFEREYYDMIRAAFLKYSLQVRMGRMDGIFVAFHNTERIFGFQYISLEEMDNALHGTMNRKLGDQEFKASVKLLNELLNKASERFPKQSLRLHIETRPTDPPLTYFFAEPVSEEEMRQTQEKGKATVEKLEREILGMSRNENKKEDTDLTDDIALQSEHEEVDAVESSEVASIDDTQRQKSWNEMMAKVDQTVENDAAGLESVREAIEQALEQSGLLAGKSEQERNTYLTELVEALAAELKDDKVVDEIDDTQQTNPAVGESESAAQSSVETSESSMEAKSELEAETTESDKATPASSTEANETAAESGAVEEVPAEMAGDGDGGNAASSTVDSYTDASLKDLILRVAQGVDNRMKNLGTFERVLSGLVQDQKQPSSEVDEIDEVDTTQSEIDLPSSTEGAEPAKEDSTKPEKEIFGVYVTVLNKVDGHVVERVESERLGEDPMWDVEYTITELPNERAWTILKQLKGRRRKALSMDPKSRDKSWHTMWGGTLARRTAAGRKFRAIMSEREAKLGIQTAWERNAVSKWRRKPKGVNSDRSTKKVSLKKRKDTKKGSSKKGSLKKGSSKKKDSPEEKDSTEKKDSSEQKTSEQKDASEKKE
ncbi:mitochondrial protein Pet127-domain-containing protein [Fusarium tricinctum]|uniref:Mitochondrial protein Pet127-domain-containing protein n=1 Tax=Fusarium tricinctum TaxID=61284 RepID=A0A8K0S1M3_9HYPO|nr:mitochondrial protein Pet127-domain-containing protein [Fusarium tricinctum]